MSSLRIAQVCPRYFPSIGGVESHVQAISERLVIRGFDVHVLTTDNTGNLPKNEIINGVTVKRFKSFAPSNSYWFSNDLNSYLEKNSVNYDIVHAHSYHAFPALYAAKARKHGRFVFTPHYHGTGHTFFRKLLHYPYTYLATTAFEHADKIICVSHYEKGLIVRKFNNLESKLLVIPNAINIADFCGKVKNSTNHQTILFVGRLEKYKGVDELIKSLSSIDSNIILKIVGTGPYEQTLVTIAKKMGVINRVVFLHDLTREELIQTYFDSDVFVLLSAHESFGICVAEALAAQIPCIVADTSALSEWIDGHSVIGVKYPLNSVELIITLKNVIGRRATMSPNLLDWADVVDRLVFLYKDISK